MVDFDAQDFFVQCAVQAGPETTLQRTPGKNEMIRDMPHIDTLAGKQADEARRLDDEGILDRQNIR